MLDDKPLDDASASTRRSSGLRECEWCMQINIKHPSIFRVVTNTNSNIAFFSNFNISSKLTECYKYCTL